MLMGQIAVQIEYAFCIRTTIDQVTNEHNPAILNIRRAFQLSDDSTQFLHLAVNIADDGNRSVDSGRHSFS
jgi:hypothetical protein